MKTLLSLVLVLFVGAALTGCAQKSEKKVETTVKTPEGETKTTEQSTTEASGDNPPSTTDPAVGTPADPTLTPPSDKPKTPPADEPAPKENP